MIISASRRTDIPAFYSDWLIQRVRAGWCEVPNPFNPSQVSLISLKPQDVDVIVFWTRNPRPLFRYLAELDERGLRYYFQFTLLDYPTTIDEHNPEVSQSLDTFRSLADRIGPKRVIWRYDPIVLSEATPPEFHQRNFAHLARELKGYSRRVVVSFLDVYAKARRRLSLMEAQGARLLHLEAPDPSAPQALPEALKILVADLVQAAADCQMEVVSCAEELDLEPCGVRAGKCIDDLLISDVFGLDVSHLKDPGQRKACGCVISKDIGMYDSCLFGCRYCYATRSFELARRNYLAHDPHAASIYCLDPHE